MPAELASRHDSLHARLITEPAELCALASHWERLLAATPQATPWQSLQWLEPWWQHLRERRRLMTVAVYRGAEPALLMPLQIGTEVFLGRTLRLLEPIGMPDDINRPALALGPPDAAALACALETLWTQRRLWDALRIDEKEPHEADVHALREFCREHGLTLRIAPLHGCPRLDLRQHWPDYLASRGRRLQKNLRASRRRLAEHGELALEVAATPPQIAVAFETFLEIQARSWKHAARIGLSRSAAYRRCFRQFLDGMARRGRARILVLRCGAQAIAATIAFLDDDTYYSAQIAHDAAFDRASPGTLLEAMEIEALMADGTWRHYDFFGAALNNKRRWTDDLRPTCRVLVLQRNVRTALFDAWYFRCKPGLRRMRGALFAAR